MRRVSIHGDRSYFNYCTCLIKWMPQFFWWANSTAFLNQLLILVLEDIHKQHMKLFEVVGTKEKVLNDLRDDNRGIDICIIV